MMMMICLFVAMSLPSGPNLKNVSLQLCDFPAKVKKQLEGCEREGEDNTAVDLKEQGVRMFTGFEVAQNFVMSRLFSRESCVKTDKINTIQQSGVGQLRSYALRQVSFGSRDS